MTLIVFCANAQNNQVSKKSLQKEIIPIPSQQSTATSINNPSFGEVFIKEKGTRLPSADGYILDIKKLRTFFKDEKIPKRFPKYLTELSFDDNKRIALHWAKKHKKLFKKEYQEMIIKKSKD